MLFGNQQFVGLYIALPDMYADQGYQQLKFMVGHLNLQDEVGKLILIAMLHLQLVTGSSQPFFKNTFPKYQKWIQKWWLTSVWQFTIQVKIVVKVSQHWTPQLRRSDGFCPATKLLPALLKSNQRLQKLLPFQISQAQTGKIYYQKFYRANACRTGLVPRGYGSRFHVLRDYKRE